MRLVLSIGRTGDTVVKAKRAKRITPEIVQCDCPECGGDGDWGKFLFTGAGCEAYAEAFGVQLPYVFQDNRPTWNCVECKGTGRVYA